MGDGTSADGVVNVADHIVTVVGSWVLPALVTLCAICVVVAFVRGEKRTPLSFGDQLRRRARYLRWLSMACLATLGAMVAAAVRTAAPGKEAAWA
jgi:hypothetical protein